MAKNFETTLQEKGIRPTAMRILVLRYLSEQKHTVSLNAIEAGMTHTDRITLYRTLKTFQDKGIVHQVDDGTGSAKYGLCFDDCETSCHHDLHVHFYCTICRETYCLPKTHVPEVSLPVKFRLDEINLIAKGTCEKCNPIAKKAT